MKHCLLIMIYRLMVLEEVDISFYEQTVALKLPSYMYYPEPLSKIYILTRHASLHFGSRNWK